MQCDKGVKKTPRQVPMILREWRSGSSGFTGATGCIFRAAHGRC